VDADSPYFHYAVAPTPPIEDFMHLTMDDREDGPDGPEPPLPTAVCAMCHRSVPVREMINLGGRALCFGCATAWFDEDEEE